MRRKHLILASCIISALLLTFTFHVSADENVTADAGASSNSAPLLDSYFWDNYELLPYIESDGSQYINTGITGSNDYIYYIKFGDVVLGSSESSLFGSRVGYQDNQLYVSMSTTNTFIKFAFYNGYYNYDYYLTPYVIYDIKFDHNIVYLNGNKVREFSDSSFDNNIYVDLFALNNNNTSHTAKGSYKLYNFYIYDDSLVDSEDPDSGEVGYLRYYYPAKSKSGDVIGLYDAVSKTFVTTATETPFASPTDDQVIHFQIGDFIESGLGWIGDILEFAIEEPMILMFMAIGLCGVAFRWARRVVHF